MYLEKIVQVVYRVPLPEAEHVKQLILGYAKQSGIADLIDDNVAGILAEGTSRNPRKIKRIINSFVLEYQLDPAWRMPPLGSAQLVRAVLLQHIYPSFYEMLVREDSDKDPIESFLDYAEIREGVTDPPEDTGDPWWETVRRVFQAYRLAVRSPIENVAVEIERLENILPEGFPGLVRSNAFVALLRGIGDSESRQSFRAQLIHRPLATETSYGASALAQSMEGVRPPLFGLMEIFTLRNDDTTEFDGLTAQAAEAVRMNEPDTIAFIVNSVPKAPMQRILYQVYRDKASYDKHIRQPYIEDFVAARKQYVLATNVIELDLHHANVSPFPSLPFSYGQSGYDPKSPDTDN